jgi:hypothetical protein
MKRLVKKMQALGMIEGMGLEAINTVDSNLIALAGSESGNILAFITLTAELRAEFIEGGALDIDTRLFQIMHENGMNWILEQAIENGLVQELTLEEAQGTELENLVAYLDDPVASLFGFMAPPEGWEENIVENDELVSSVRLFKLTA